DSYAIEEFLINGNIEYLHLDIKDNNKILPVTLEGQVVAIADEIAQRGHDLDDAFASGLLNLNSFKDSCEISEMKSIYKIIEQIENKIEEYKGKGRVIIDKNDMIRAMLVPKILGYFINDIVVNSKSNMRDYEKEYIDDFN
ncbi:hypothetical protein, partial [Stenotrophomonas maltophilia group sp. RNC7]|uniref:hypothetical protein n=1 Tax=Stenotrophomonas maltophilia group sp. RNC7 TaxID=3071467 RepID=UPI0027DF8F79